MSGGKKHPEVLAIQTIDDGTGPDGAVTMSTANGTVGTGFAYRYRLQLGAGF